MSRPYNTTDLDPEHVFERHVFHRDQFAHYLRWTFVLKEARIGDRVVDFGCGKGSLLEVLYRNRFRPQWYVGFDIRKRTIDQANQKYESLPFPALFYTVDLVKDDVFPFLTAHNITRPDRVCSFEVLEHVGKQNVPRFLENFRVCGGDGATYYLSTPNYDPQVGAAGNHTYDSGDGRGVAEHEWDYHELNDLIESSGFEIVNEFGTFASQRDYKSSLTPAQAEIHAQLKEYYDANLVSNIMAPLVPAKFARNCLRVMVRA